MNQLIKYLEQMKSQSAQGEQITLESITEAIKLAKDARARAADIAGKLDLARVMLKTENG
ncbi:hypothetical protein ACT7V1_004161 [Salmonella enterica subsp. enterica]|nr:hypothetical protein [Salmonella enterica subsp. enterica serovar Kentucky]EGI6509421.1 hypothetical protein [Salmonella enterica subsp. enterica serovar Durham]EHW9667336.1 hypothetical protein [Salmonella enterica subsp. enterica serovar Agbeni]EJI2509778.1 hypothetical protein [Salmonella enterica]EIU1267266.1 hypothetical protein [Salmonella enterica subsp. enterica serovar Agbeni]